MVLPVAVVVWAGFHYLTGFPTDGNDLWLIALLTLIGLALGLASAATTFMWRDETGQVLGRAGVWACVTWVTGMGFRFTFALYATSKAGDRGIGTFSRHHGISGSQAWTTALVLMAFRSDLTSRHAAGSTPEAGWCRDCAAGADGGLETGGFCAQKPRTVSKAALVNCVPVPVQGA